MKAYKKKKKSEILTCVTALSYICRMLDCHFAPSGSKMLLQAICR